MANGGPGRIWSNPRLDLPACRAARQNGMEFTMGRCQASSLWVVLVDVRSPVDDHRIICNCTCTLSDKVAMLDVLKRHDAGEDGSIQYSASQTEYFFFSPSLFRSDDYCRNRNANK